MLLVRQYNSANFCVFFWLDHCDVIASCSDVRRAAQRSWTLNWVKVIYSSSFDIKHKPIRGFNGWRYIRQIQQISVCPSFSKIRAIAFIQTQRGWQCSLDFQEQDGSGGVQWELYGTNFRENIANLRVLRYYGNNDRSARVLFVQHPREQGEWLRQNLRSGFAFIIRPVPSGARRTTPSQPGHYPLISNCTLSNTLQLHFNGIKNAISKMVVILFMLPVGYFHDTNENIVHKLFRNWLFFSF